ncbi:beta-1,3-galactosyltransferase 1-like [Panulirus ornatus]|uniref:beta-1,3-galactosyltransferase 1-like n=1 Tax=Panulirus ornatus TaxID=150431 RepID=UPI003A84EA69
MLSNLRRLHHTLRCQKWSCCLCRPAAWRVGSLGLVVVAAGAVILLVVLLMGGQLRGEYGPTDTTLLKWGPQASFTRHNGGSATDGDTVNSGQLKRRAFQYIIEEPDVCRSHPDVQIISYVHSAVMKVENRQLIRDTWGNLRYYPQVRMRVIFVFGSAATEEEQRMLSEESKAHHDIIQLDFVDSYKNLSYKVISRSFHC